jgi:hypothetical protein
MVEARFRLLRGKHYIVSEKRFLRKGDIITIEKERMKAFMDRFELVDEDDSVDVPPASPLIMKKRIGRKGVSAMKWDVVNSKTDKRLNNVPLTENEAKELISEYRSEEIEEGEEDN